MAKIVCTKCGKTGDSKCPFCRSVFGDEDSRIGMIDAVMSHRLLIGEKGILLKRWSLTRNPDNSIGGPETDFNILKSVVGLLKDLTDDELRIIACAHTWDFAPGAKSEIDCGHKYEPPMFVIEIDAMYDVDGTVVQLKEGDSDYLIFELEEDPTFGFTLLKDAEGNYRHETSGDVAIIKKVE